MDFYDDVEEYIDYDKIELMETVENIPFDESKFVEPEDDIIDIPIF